MGDTGLAPHVASMSCPVNPLPALSQPETKWAARKGRAPCSGKIPTQVSSCVPEVPSGGGACCYELKDWIQIHVGILSPSMVAFRGVFLMNGIGVLTKAAPT